MEDKIKLNIELRNKLQLELETEKFTNLIERVAWWNKKETTHKTVPAEIMGLLKGKNGTSPEIHQTKVFQIT